MKILFMGTPQFAVPCLENIIKAGHDVCGVFTQPDKPKGRGYVLTPPPVKICAIEHDLEVFQPKSLKTEEAFEIISNKNPDAIVVVAYGKILPAKILDFPKYGCINVHGSLLPKYRGAAPIQWAVINGEKITGVTTMYMDVGLDTGDMLLKSETEILDNETAGELYDRLSKIGADLIVKTLDMLKNQGIEREKQDESKVTHSKMLDKSMGMIDWQKPALEIHNLVRGLNPWPTAFTKLNEKILKIHKTEVPQEKGGESGKILSLDPFIVGCGKDSAIKLMEVQYEGKKRMQAADFIRGHKLAIGDKLG